MSTPEQQMKPMRTPESCGEECSYKGTGSCGFESCPFDEFPENRGGNTSEVCPICGSTFNRPRLDHYPIMCPECTRKLRILLVEDWSTLKCLVDTGGYEGYCK